MTHPGPSCHARGDVEVRAAEAQFSLGVDRFLDSIGR